MTVALVSNIARPISSAISTAFSADSYGLLSSYGLLGASASPDAVIEALFANSEVGAWYDPSDLTTMFQDRAGTTPVTADGQTVGKILDKSGRGNHAVAPSDAARPLYKTDGTYHWLQFDGVNDSLSTAAIDFTSTDKMSVFSGVHKPNNTTIGALLCFGDGGSEGNFLYYIPGDAGGNHIEAGSFIGSNGYARWDSGTPPDTSVFSGAHDNSQSIVVNRYKMRRNGAELTPIASYSMGTPGNFSNSVLAIGQRASGYFLVGNIYSLIVRGALSTTQEITDTETWVNSKCGAF